MVVLLSMGLYVCSPVVQVSQLIVVLERLVELLSVPAECEEAVGR